MEKKAHTRGNMQRSRSKAGCSSNCTENRRCPVPHPTTCQSRSGTSHPIKTFKELIHTVHRQHNDILKESALFEIVTVDHQPRQELRKLSYKKL